MKKLIFLSLAIILFHTGYAGKVTFNNKLSGTAITNAATLETEDDRYSYMTIAPTNATWPNEFTNYNVTNRISLKYTDALRRYYSFNWSIAVPCTLNRWDETGAALTAQTFTLMINYDPASGISYTNNSVYKSSDGHKAQLILGTPALSPSSGFSIPADVILENEIEVERYYAFDQAAAGYITNAIDAAGKTMEFKWDYMPGAEEYDLEWLFVSAYDAATGNPDFSKATRITTTQQFYEIPLTYDQGTMYYRVRGHGRMGSSFDIPKTGVWTEGTPAGITAFDETRNWQYSVSYAEEGKASEGISYLDGTLRGRQDIARNNTEDIALVSESMYDYEGRAAIRTMPVPYLHNAGAFDPSLEYKESMSLNSSGVPYSRKDFDTDELYSSCVPSASPGMKDTQGASHYYSPNNPRASEGFNAAIPDAEDYPFAQVTYGLDGKVNRQSGVGPDHKIASGHESQYYEATPLQYNLDRLFGNEAGYAMHYRKRVSIDANGQMSVSYHDLSGNVIATALAGNAPANVTQLDNFASQAVTADFDNLNQWSPTENGMVMSSSLLVMDAGQTYNFTYTLSPEQFQSLCTSTTHDCKYDLLITIFDECNQKVNDNLATHIVHETQVIDGGSYSSQTPYTVSFSVNFPRTGTYYIKKLLTLNAPSVQDEITAFKAALPGTCFVPPSPYEIDNSECEACTTGCADPVTSSVNCEILLEQLREDMSPGGQYFDNMYQGKNPATADNGWISYPGSSIPFTLPNIWADNDLSAWSTAGFQTASNLPIQTWADMRTHWEQDWEIRQFSSGSINGKTSIVEFHPEYCHYEWCLTYEPSMQFDVDMHMDGTYAWATSHPSGTPYIDINQTPVGLNVLNLDPYFSGVSAVGASDKPAMYDASTNTGYLVDNDGNGVSMWTQAGNIANCSNCNEQWQVFRSLYLARKGKMMRDRKIAGGCNALVDITIPPDNIADNCTDCFLIREPDHYDAMADLTTATAMNDYGDALNSAYNTCKVPAALTYATSVHPGSFVATPVTITVSSATLSVTGLEITGGFCCIGENTSQGLAAAAVQAINYHVSSPYDFTAKIDPANPGNFIIYAPATLGADGNTFEATVSNSNSGVTILCPACSPSPSTDEFTDGLNVGKCDYDTPDCFCVELQQMKHLYNTIDPGSVTIDNPSGDYYVDHTTYSSVNAYIEATFEDNYGVDITSTQISAWLNNCDSTGNTDPEQFNGITTAVPEAIDCDTEPICSEDATSIAGYFEQQAYDLAAGQSLYDFIAGYTAQCFYTGNFNENFTVSFTEKEYHYTLYFYDRAGNLVKTVPPKAVVPLTNLQPVEDFRDNVTGSSFTQPAHNWALATVYKYNTRDQLTETTSPDGGRITYWYNTPGQMRFSQNAKQDDNGSYSYTLYDPKGRITEVGESQELYNATAFYNGADDAAFPSTGTEVTNIYYDVPLNSSLGQEYLRDRVATITYELTDDATSATYDHATHYSYDVHGNVHTLKQDNPELTALQTQQYKTIEYDYDLLSGNTNEVRYQPGELDQFTHRYWYDADNRLTNVWTSRDGVIWDQDAKYYYNLHGPLARTETGNEKVQASDYAWTIMGWLKGVNSNVLDRTKDIGRDGLHDGNNTGSYIASKKSLHSNIAADAYAFNLGYYSNIATGETDYMAITGLTLTGQGLDNLNNTADNLYNGNIKEMALALMKNNGAAPVAMDLMVNQYHYDQLHRLKTVNRYISTNTASYINATNTNDYREAFEYDPNGNITTVLRKGYAASGNQDMDDIDYNYYANSNKLEYITDATPAANYTTDIDDQATGNYVYDDIGNLIKDVQEEIDKIEWDVYNRPIKIIRKSTSTKADLEFKYDANGHRVVKLEKPRSGTGIKEQKDWTYTYYVRDVAGNIMAMYKKTYRHAGGSTYAEEFAFTDHHMYGGSRLGVREESLVLVTKSFTSTGFDAASKEFTGVSNEVVVQAPAASTTAFTRSLGKKQYEFTNHLGNVLVTLNDRKLGVDVDGVTDSDGNKHIEYYLPDVLSTTDYYAFGAEMPGRQGVPAMGRYRFGFNGMERDGETPVDGNSYTTDFRQYDPRLGRWLSVDPIVHEWESPYVGFANNPIYFADPSGLSPNGGGNGEGQPNTRSPDGNADDRYLGERMPTEATVSVDASKADERWKQFLRDIGYEGYQDFISTLYNAKYEQYNTGIGRGMYGADRNGNVILPADINARLHREAEAEAMPTLKSVWAAEKSGVDPTSANFMFNPFARAKFYNWRARTVSTSDEGWDLVQEVGIEVAFSWLARFSISKNAWEARKSYDLNDPNSFIGADPESIKAYLVRIGWKIQPLKKGKPGFRAVNPQNNSDVIHIMQGNAEKLKEGTTVLKVKQGDYMKRPFFDWDRIPLKGNPNVK